MCTCMSELILIVVGAIGFGFFLNQNRNVSYCPRCKQGHSIGFHHCPNCGGEMYQTTLPQWKLVQNVTEEIEKKRGGDDDV